MLKPLLSSAVILVMLCAPTLADTPKPAPAASATSMRFQVKVTDGAEMRTYDLTLLPETCGFVEEHAGERVDEVKLCAHDAPNGVRLAAQWKLHAKLLDHAVSFEAVIAKGKSVEVGREKGARLTLTLI